MSKFSFKKFIPAGIGLVAFAAFVGSISGSLAWWAYSTRASVSYQGTSVTTSRQLQIGVKLDTSIFDTDEKVQALAAYGLDEDTTIANAEYRYVFTKAGTGINAEALHAFLTAEGLYSTNELCPVTTYQYTTGSALTLYEPLMSGKPMNETIALTNKYVHIPFVFRIQKLNQMNTYVSNQKIYLSAMKAAASSVNPLSTVQNGLRVFFDNGTAAERFIFNVGGTNSTVVAGVLDLNEDGLYDTYSSNDPNANKEIIYGDYEVTSSEDLFDQTVAPTKMTDINNTGDYDDAYLSDLTNRSTFLAMHGYGYSCYNSYTGLSLKQANYLTLADIKPTDVSGSLTGGRALTTTAAESGNFLAELDTTIWLEGWDHNVIDSARSHKFELGLQFQIDLEN